MYCWRSVSLPCGQYMAIFIILALPKIKGRKTSRKHYNHNDQNVMHYSLRTYFDILLLWFGINLSLLVIISSFIFSRCNEGSSIYSLTKQICFVFVSYHRIVFVFVTHQSRWAKNHSSCVHHNEYFGSREDWRQSRRKKWPRRHQRWKVFRTRCCHVNRFLNRISDFLENRASPHSCLAALELLDLGIVTTGFLISIWVSQ